MQGLGERVPIYVYFRQPDASEQSPENLVVSDKLEPYFLLSIADLSDEQTEKAPRELVLACFNIESTNYLKEIKARDASILFPFPVQEILNHHLRQPGHKTSSRRQFELAGLPSASVTPKWLIAVSLKGFVPHQPTVAVSLSVEVAWRPIACILCTPYLFCSS